MNAVVQSIPSGWVLFQPLDVVTFRDGRPFSAGLTATARTTLPRPTTTGGALKAVFGRCPREVAGPVLAVQDGERVQVLLPAPANLVVDRYGTATQLRPDEPVAAPAGLSLTTDIVFSGELGPGFRLLAGEGEPIPNPIGRDAMESYLDGDARRALATVEDVGGSEPLTRERRLGLARHPRAARNAAGRTTITGFLYLAEFWRPMPDQEDRLGFACRVWFDDPLPDLTTDLVRFGGEGRQAKVRLLADSTADSEPGVRTLPQAPAEFPGGKVLLYLATPAVFTSGWLPSGIEGADLVAACTSGPEQITGWEPDEQALSGGGRPRRLRWAVGAGSVYFLRFADVTSARTFTSTYHGRCLPQAEEWMRTVGFGMCLVGRW